MLRREHLKLADLHRGIKDMRHLPAAIFVVDANHEKIAVSEGAISDSKNASAKLSSLGFKINRKYFRALASCVSGITSEQG